MQSFSKVKFQQLLVVIGHWRSRIDYKIRKPCSTPYLGNCVLSTNYLESIVFCYQGCARATIYISPGTLMLQNFISYDFNIQAGQCLVTAKSHQNFHSSEVLHFFKWANIVVMIIDTIFNQHQRLAQLNECGDWNDALKNRQRLTTGDHRPKKLYVSSCYGRKPYKNM